MPRELFCLIDGRVLTPGKMSLYTYFLPNRRRRGSINKQPRNELEPKVHHTFASSSNMI